MRPPIAFLFVGAALLAGPMAAQAMIVPLNHSVRLNIAGTASSVVVGNPAIADVTVVDSHTVFVSGRGYGSTDVVVLDGGGRTLFDGDVTVSAAGGSVSLFRGAEKSNLACDPGCRESPETVAAKTPGDAMNGAMATISAAAMQSVASQVAASPPPHP